MHCSTSVGLLLEQLFSMKLLSEFVFSFRTVLCLSVSLTNDSLSKAIMDPSSVQLFSNIVFVTGGGVGCTWGTLLLVYEVPEIVW